MKRLLIALVVLMMTSIAFARQADLPDPTPVSITAGEEAVLVGDFYATADTAPAVLLLHMDRGSRSQWVGILPDLLTAGYNVLAVDLRAMGESGGDRDFVLAQEDTLLWLAWMREQPSVDPERIATIGASIGSTLALLGCTADEQCAGTVLLSPGVSYFGVETVPAMEDLGNRPALIAASRRDSQSAADTITLAETARGDVSVQLYTGAAHGTMMFVEPTLIPSIMQLLESAFE